MTSHDPNPRETVLAIDELLKDLDPGDYQRKQWPFERIRLTIETQREIIATGDFKRLEDYVKSTSYHIVDSFDWQDPLYPIVSRVNAMANQLVRKWKRGEFDPKD